MNLTGSEELAHVRRERDLYLRLLELGRETAIEPFLQEALLLLVGMTGARQGYLELVDRTDASAQAECVWFRAHGFSTVEIEQVRVLVSRGIIAEVLASGKAVLTPAAVFDPRFNQRASVSSAQIGAVCCAPIGTDPTVGVVYLQGGDYLPMLSDDCCHAVETVARLLAPLAQRILQGYRDAKIGDPTAASRTKLTLPGVIGRSQALARVLQQAQMVAPLDVTVLLTGESGTGKSQLAHIIHANGPRADAPFVELNCAALPETLVESELFGAVPGAHSTANRAIQGKVAAAEGGTLLLDEVGDLPFSAQGKLLHLLQTREYYPLGSARPARANVRIIAATNMDLRQAVADRRFREDLFYRLEVMPIGLPSLAERREDIAELAAYFCTEACQRHQLGDLCLSATAVRRLELAEWPGNIRQLANVVEAAVIRAVSEGSSAVEVLHLFPDASACAEIETPGSDTEAASLWQGSFHQATREFQTELLRRTLKATGWNVTEAARRLDLARSHVHRLIRHFGLTEEAQGS
ncbi:MAG: sigma 54-interacting transcriptional regulator [Candidatus Binatia bacterium]|nr:sigma 54-interacting transcriptional regulator [Candidatus Binatia bacterium]